MSNTNNADTRDLAGALGLRVPPAIGERNPMRRRPHPDQRTTRAMDKVRDMLTIIPEELVDRDTLSALLAAAEDAQYAVADAERYHGLWMEAQDEVRRLREQEQERDQEAPVLHLPAAEPPNMTVVVDREGDAWQRDDSLCGGTEAHWYVAGSDDGWPWGELLVDFGPVRLVYTPEG